MLGPRTGPGVVIVEAIVQERYGGPAVLTLNTVGDPEPGPGEDDHACAKVTITV